MKRPIKSQFEDFTDELIGRAQECFTFDGADIQNIAVRHGLLEKVSASESCGKNCACEEFGFPVECFRKTY